MILCGNGFYLLSLFQSCGSKNVEGRKMKKNLLLIGSENVVTQQYVDIHKNNYENIVGIDISDFSKLKLYKKSRLFYLKFNRGSTRVLEQY